MDGCRLDGQVISCTVAQDRRKSPSTMAKMEDTWRAEKGKGGKGGKDKDGPPRGKSGERGDYPTRDRDFYDRYYEKGGKGKGKGKYDYYDRYYDRYYEDRYYRDRYYDRDYYKGGKWGAGKDYYRDRDYYRDMDYYKGKGGKWDSRDYYRDEGKGGKGEFGKSRYVVH